MGVSMNTMRWACLLLAAASLANAAEEIRFDTADGVAVTGDWYRTDDSRLARLILLFHQGGGDARGEYGSIAPRLNKLGFDVIAIDQRRGGGRLDGVNRTVAALGDREFGYCDAYPDLEGAIEFARRQGYEGPMIAWGSSYSAALVFKLAVDHRRDIGAVLAFSPAAGPPLADCPLSSQLDSIDVPVLALRPASEFEIESVQSQMAEFEKHGIQTYVADPGVHGSSMLNEARVGSSTEAAWAVVTDFLARAIE